MIALYFSLSSPFVFNQLFHSLPFASPCPFLSLFLFLFYLSLFFFLKFLPCILGLLHLLRFLCVCVCVILSTFLYMSFLLIPLFYLFSASVSPPLEEGKMEEKGKQKEEKNLKREEEVKRTR